MLLIRLLKVRLAENGAPDKNGFDIFGILSLSRKARNTLKIKIHMFIPDLLLEVRSKCFVGASITSAAALPCADLSKK